MGKDFGGKHFVITPEGFFSFPVEGAHFGPPIKSALPGPLRNGPGGPIVKFRVGEWWWKKGENQIYWLDPKLKKWFLRYQAPVNFSTFEILFDGTVLLIGTSDAKTGWALNQIEALKDSGQTQVLLPWTKSATPDEKNLEFFEHHSIQYLVFDEYILVYKPLSGSLMLLDSANLGTPRTVDLPWTPGMGKPVHAQLGPRCRQWIPTPEKALILVYDAASILTREEEQKIADALREGTPQEARPRRWKALKVQLADGKTTEVEVAPGATFPFWTMDGYKVISLTEALEGPKEKQPLRAPKATSASAPPKQLP